MNFGNMSWIDWAIMLVSIVILRVISANTRHYMKSVADFLSANRSAGRYLLTIAGQMGGTGAISVVAMFEIYYSAGLPPLYWALMSIPVGVILTFVGFVYYRFRETRAMTMAQFFEMRYSRKFRIFAGIICWACGILNFGIFPAIAARFFVYFCGLPVSFELLGFTVPMIAPVMAIDLILALTFVTMGGQISVMITECAQGMVSAFIFVILAGFVIFTIHWSDMVSAMNMAPVGKSMLNPFQTGQIKDFNVWFYLIGIFGTIYGYMSWQGSQGFFSSARSPHESKMGSIIGVWRQIPLNLMLVLLPIAAYTILKMPEFSSLQHTVDSALKTLPNENLQNQMRVPLVLAHWLPAGIKGLLATCMLFFSFTCHDTYMHSWGSIFVQDVLAPLRKKALTPQQHVTWLRRSIIGVAVFGFLFSLFYPLDRPIAMFFAVTGAIWLGGAGACIVGGLYWKKGTTVGAFGALIVGAVIGVAGLIIPIIYKNHTHKDFPINDQWLWMIAMVSAIIVYIVLSLVTYKGNFNLMKMFHRGEYADDKTVHEVHLLKHRWMQFIGITPEFSVPDRYLAFASITWNFAWIALFLITLMMHLFGVLPNSFWPKFWHIWIWLYFIISIPITIWFTIGGILDIKHLFKTLDSTVRDHSDDGSVNRE